jgi:hypothetical protein
MDLTDASSGPLGGTPLPHRSGTECAQCGMSRGRWPRCSVPLGRERTIQTAPGTGAPIRSKRVS